MKIHLVMLNALLFCSCKLNYNKDYSYKNAYVRYSYRFEDSGRFTKTNDVELLNYMDTGSVIKRSGKYYLKGKLIIDTLCIYEFEPNKNLDSGYYIDLSNLLLSRNNDISNILSQDSLSIKLNGLPIENYKVQIKNLGYKFNSPIIKLEISDKKGVSVFDYIKLKHNYILRFSKIREDEWTNEYFKLSLTGNKIFVHNRFIGTSLYFKEKFKKEKEVYRINR